MTRPPPEVVCVGEALVDFFPAEEGARGRALRDVARFERHSGGAPANTAIGLARLGVRAALVTMLGEDEFGHFLAAHLAAEGVDVRACWTREARTGLAFVGWDARGDRRFLFYRRPSADELLDAAAVDAAAAAVTGARFVHLCTNTLIRAPARAAHRRAMELAAGAGVPLLVDLNLRIHLWPTEQDAFDAARTMAAAATVLKVDGAEAQALTGESDPVAAARALVRPDARSSAGGCATVLSCVTLGENGAAWARRGGGAGLKEAPVVDVLDTTGAGDAFTAALAAAVLAAGGDAAALDDASAAAAVAAAVAAGSACVTRVGATTAMPRGGR